MENKTVALLLTLTVGVIMVGALVAPIVASYGYETSTYYNEGMPYAEVDDETHVITVTSDAIKVDNAEIDTDLFPSGFTAYTIVYGEETFIRLSTYDVTIRGADSGNIWTMSYADGETITISILGSVATVTSSDTDVTSRSISDALYYVSTSGDYVLSLNPVVLSDSQIYGAGQTHWTASDEGYPANLDIYTAWRGTIEAITGDLIYVTASYSDTSITGFEINTTEENNGLYTIDSILVNYSVTYTETSTEYEPVSTYTYFLAPAELVYDNPNYIGFGVAGIMGALVVVCILSLVVMAAKGMENRDL